jgi:hypothetical protein
MKGYDKDASVPRARLQMSSSSSSQDIFLFVDLSNLQYSYKRGKNMSPTASLPEGWFKSLDRILRDNHQKITKSFLVGSTKDKEYPDQIFKEAAQCNYKVSILGLVGGREQGVDEMLQIRMYETYCGTRKPGYFVLATGDGDVSDYSAGFLPIVQALLNRGWHGEVRGFYDSTSKNWAKLSKDVNNRLKIRYIDANDCRWPETREDEGK